MDVETHTEKRKRRAPGQGLKITFAARWSEADLAEIKARAVEAGMSASEYVRRCALGTLDYGEHKWLQRHQELEDRISKLEERIEAASAGDW